MLTSVQRRILQEQGVLDTGTRAKTAGVDHPVMMNPVPAGSTGIKGHPDTSEHPQGSLHPQTIQTNQAIDDLETAVRMIEMASARLEKLNNGALAATADSIRDLHRLMLEHISDLKDQAARYISKNRPNELEQAKDMLRRTP